VELITALRLQQALESRQPAVVTVVGGGGKTSLVFRLAGEVQARGGRVVTATTTRVAVHQLARAPALLRLRDGRLENGAWGTLAEALDRHSHCFVVGSEVLLKGKQAGVEPEVVEALAARAAALGIAAIVVEGDGSRTLPVKAPAEHEPVIPPSTTLVLSALGLDAIGAPLVEERCHRSERIRALLGLPAQGPERLTPADAARLLLHPQGGAKGVPPGARFLPVLNKADVAHHLAPGRLTAELLAHSGRPCILAAAGNETQPAVVERWGPVAAVVLAAGESRRFGAPKQLATVDGEAMVVRATRRALESGAQQVLVITGAYADQVQAVLEPLRRQAGARLRLVVNEEWATGQSSSLRVAVEALEAEAGGSGFEALLCLPVDQPWLESALLRRLVQAWRAGAALAAPSVEGELRGAPALFDRSFFAALREVEGDKGGRDLLRRHAEQLVALPVDALTLADIDTPADLNAGVGR
jgi:molybdenum cofactor cytidylyltransferase